METRTADVTENAKTDEELQLLTIQLTTTEASDTTNGSRKPRFEDRAGTTLSFHNINYTVPAKVDGKKGTKIILNSVSGVFKPGMNAIIGPSGSGKTSLMDVLAARKDRRGLEGTVLIDGYVQPSNFRLVSGYVIQDDVVMGTLTVRENLAFSASLRLPSTLSAEEKNTRVDTVIKELGLERCKDTKIGTDFIRGVSGGERKRTNVGMELITGPEVLFLDEPTTGLDAYTAASIMEVLARLSNNGKTIIFSIHQPRYSIYRLFDTLHILGKGETIYHGPAADALEHFASAGYRCETHNNPPDFFLDVINSSFKSKSDDIEGEQVLESGVDTNSSLVEHYLKSSYNGKSKKELDSIWTDHNDIKEVDKRIIEYQSSFLKQMVIVSRRAIVNLVRSPEVAGIQTAIMVVLALLIGTIFFDVDDSITSGIQNRYGAFFFMTMMMVFTNQNAIQVFIQERVIFLHESANGFYRVSCYFFSKVFFDLLPLRLVPTIAFSLITYWMIGLRADVTKFFIYSMNLLMTTMAGALMAFCIGARISTISVAMALIPLCYVLMMIFGGLFVNITSLPVWLQWLKWFSIFRYSLNTLSVNEFSGMTFVEGNFTIEGDTYLEDQGIATGRWGLWQNQLALFIMQMVFLVLTYIQLRTAPKWK